MPRGRIFNPTNKPDTCLWCGAALQKAAYTSDNVKLGPYMDGFFCTMRCAYQFAVELASRGRRLVIKGDK